MQQIYESDNHVKQTDLPISERLSAAYEYEKKLFDEIRRLREQLLQLQEENLELKARADKLALDMENAEADNRAQMDELLADRNALKSDLSSIIAHLHASDSLKDAHISEKDRTIKELRKRSAALEGENAELRGAARSSNQSKDSLYRQLEISREKVHLLQTTMRERQQAFDDILSALNFSAITELTSQVSQVLSLLPPQSSKDSTHSLAVRVEGDAIRLERDIETVKNSDLFDEIWYMSRYGDVIPEGECAAHHFVTQGFKMGFSPCAAFDAPRYFQENLDVAASNLNPLLHYLLYGKEEGRSIFSCESASAL